MTWLGGTVLGLGVLLIMAVAGVRILEMVRRRTGGRAKGSSYEGRLDPEVDLSGAEVELSDTEEVIPMAEALIREHGADAVTKAAKRALSGFQEGDSKRRDIWRRVLELAEERLEKEKQRDEAAE